MKIKDLPKGILNYLWKWEYREKVADKELYRDLQKELDNFGYKMIDKDVFSGDYNDLRGYLGCEIVEVKE